MKLKDYAKHLSKLAKQYPDIQVFISTDEEGNGFYKARHPDCSCFVEATNMCYYLEFVIGPEGVDEYEGVPLERICIL